MPTSINDDVLLRIIEEISKPLAQMDVHCSTDEILSSYNALLGAAQANHPDVSLLAALEPLPLNGINAGPMLALLAQLRIILEYLQPR
ncbi:MAG: hypothetical protein JWL77_3273 [Chthonomonadaceae bacterium]|nr:hypothetical protein [Chthonomonadaceae bacterium]